MSTVRYGDQFPITNPGRALGTFIIIVGVGIFGTLTGHLANLFLCTAKKPDATEPPDIQKKLTALRSLMAQQQVNIDDLEALIDRQP